MRVHNAYFGVSGEGNIIHLLGLLILTFVVLLALLEGFYLFGLLDGSTRFTLLDTLRNAVCG